jgi:hypothetical protein
MVLLGMMNLNIENQRRVLSVEVKDVDFKKSIRNDYHWAYTFSFPISLLSKV